MSDLASFFFFHETTTAKWSLSSTYMVIKALEQKRNWTVFRIRFSKISVSLQIGNILSDGEV